MSEDMKATRTESKPPWWKGKRGEWYVVAQVFVFSLVVLGPRTLPGLPAWPVAVASVSSVLGVALLIVGAILSLVALLRLGDSLSVLPYPLDDSNLVESGPYRIVRHPIYSGILMGSLGWAFWVHGWLTLVYVVGVFIFVDAKSRLEERWLCSKFPAYAEYQTRVHKLIPWVY